MIQTTVRNIKLFCLALFFIVGCSTTPKIQQNQIETSHEDLLILAASFLPRKSDFVARIRVKHAFKTLRFYNEETLDKGLDKQSQLKNLEIMHSLKTESIKVFGGNILNADEILIAGRQSKVVAILSGISAETEFKSTEFVHVRRERGLVLLYVKRFAKEIIETEGIPVKNLEKIKSKAPLIISTNNFSKLPVSYEKRPDVAWLALEKNGLIKFTIEGTEKSLDFFTEFLSEDGGFDALFKTQIVTFGRTLGLFKRPFEFDRSEGKLVVQSVLLEPIQKSISAEAFVIFIGMMVDLHYRRSFFEEEPNEFSVVHTKKEIQKGTLLTENLIEFKKVPYKFLPPNPLYEKDLSIYLDSEVAVDIKEGAMVLTSDFSVVEPVMRLSDKILVGICRQKIRVGEVLKKKHVRFEEIEMRRLPRGNFMETEPMKSFFGRKMKKSVKKGAVFLESDFEINVGLAPN